MSIIRIKKIHTSFPTYPYMSLYIHLSEKSFHFSSHQVLPYDNIFDNNICDHSVICKSDYKFVVYI